MKPERLILFVLAAVNFTHIVDSMIMMPLGDIFMKLFDIKPHQFSLLVSAYAIGAFFSSLFGIFLLDHFDRKKALLFLYAGFTIGTLSCALANSYLVLLSIRFLTGLFGGMIGALVLSIISDVFPFERRGSAMGVLMAAFSAAAALGVPAGLILTDWFNWHAPFYFVGSIGGMLLIMIFIFFPTMTGHFSSIDKTLSMPQVVRNITDDNNQLNALALGMVLVLGHFLIIPFIAPYFTRNAGFAQEEIKYLYLAGGTLTVFTAPFFGKLTDRYGALRIFIILMVISFASVIWLTNLGPVSLTVGLLASSVFFVFGSGRMIAPQTMITAAVGPKNRGSFMSVKSALQQLSIALASIIGGWIIAVSPTGSLKNYEWVGYLSIAICIAALFMAKRLKVAEGN